MTNFLKSNKGFSLPEIMIAVAISGVVALGAAKMMSDNQMNQSYIQTMAEINNMTNVVKMAIGDKKNCNSFIAGRTRGGEAVLVGGVDFTSIDIGDPSRKTSLVQVQPFTYGKFSVRGIRLYSSAENPKIKKLELVFDFKNSPFLKDAGTDRKRIIKNISFLADYKMGTTGLPDNSDPLECGDLVEDTLLESQEALCNSLGSEFAVWGTPIANKCNIKEFKCPPGQVPWVVTSLGKVVCKNTEETLDPNALIDGAPVSCPEDSANIRVEFSGGRYRLVCSGGCTPAISCTAIAATYCPAEPTQNNSCGINCGTGTKSSGCAFGPPASCAPNGMTTLAACPNGTSHREARYNILDASSNIVGTCIDDRANYNCAGYPKSNNCPALTGCPVDCTPAVHCSSKVTTYCAADPVQLDTCGSSCGPGTKTSGCGGGTLPNGTYCDTSGGSCAGNSCANCINPPLTNCGVYGVGYCGQSTTCPRACI